MLIRLHCGSSPIASLLHLLFQQRAAPPSHLRTLCTRFSECKKTAGTPAAVKVALCDTWLCQQQTCTAVSPREETLLKVRLVHEDQQAMLTFCTKPLLAVPCLGRSPSHCCPPHSFVCSGAVLQHARHLPQPPSHLGRQLLSSWMSQSACL